MVTKRCKGTLGSHHSKTSVGLALSILTEPRSGADSLEASLLPPEAHLSPFCCCRPPGGGGLSCSRLAAKPLSPRGH